MPDIQMTSERNIQKTGLKVTLPQVQATKEAELWQFCVELSGLAVKLEAECSPVLCTQARTASEQWVFMRGVGTSHKECSVVDYTKHTADVAARLLNTKYFPNRVSIKKSPASKLCSVCQCIYKIFSHAYFYHRALFEEHEAETSMCQRFTSYIIKYNLMPKDSLLVPVIKDEDTEIRESEA